MRSSRTVVAVLATAGLVALSGCGGDDTPAGSETTPQSTISTTPSATPPAPSVSTPAASPPPTAKPTAAPSNSADVTVDVSIAAGKISAGGHAVVKAGRGQRVRINGVSDVAESLHVHGYDKTLELKPGKAASVEFVTDTKGIFEVETHESGKLVFKLQVS